MSDPHTGNDQFIVDNSDTDGKVRDYLKKWCALSRTVDIAAGYFEIGALLALGGTWSGVQHLRILLGDEVSLRTQRVFAESLRKIQQRLEASAEEEKRRNDFPSCKFSCDRNDGVSK